MLRRHAAVGVLFIALAIAMTWPLATHLSMAGGDDPLTSAWALDWDYYATFHGASLFNANMFAPARFSLAFGEHLYGVAIFAFPLFVLGLAPLTIHNVLLLAGFAASGFAMYLLANRITGSIAAAIVGGIAYAFVGMRFHHLAHVHLVWTMWMPLLLLESIEFAAAPSIGRSTWLSLLLILNGLTSLHWFAFGTLATFITIAVLAIADGHVRDTRLWLLLAAAFSIAAIVLAPFLLPYARVARMYGMQRTYAEVLPNGAQWHDWLVPNVQSKAYGFLSAADSYGHERTLFPGFITIALAFVALVGDIRRKTLDRVIPAALLASGIAALVGRGVAVGIVVTAMLVIGRITASGLKWDRNPLRDRAFLAACVWLVIGGWGARGLYGAFHSFLFKYTSVFRGMRMPARWVFVAYVGLDLMAAIDMQRILGTCTRKTRLLFTTIVSVALLIELRAAPMRLFLMPDTARPVYTWLARVSPHGALLELPMTQTEAYTYLWRATVHHHPIMNGVTSYIPPHYQKLQSAYDTTPIDPTFMTQLEMLHCALIVVHGEELGARSEAIRAWLRSNMANGHLEFVRRFDGGNRGDYVFAVLRNEPAAAEWRDSHASAERFLNGEWTYSAQPIASVDSGPPIGTSRGELTVSGWAVAPSGVRAVNLRFANGRYIVHADRNRRADVNAFLPWYTPDELAGFEKTLRQPPRFIRGDTDLQIEVVDGSGNRVRMTPFWFRWLPAPSSHVVWNGPEITSLLERLGSNTPQNRARLFSGSAAIHDFTSSLLSDRELETDSAFVVRALTTLLGATDAALTNRLLEMLANGTSRERVIDAVLTSREFHAKYVLDGKIVID